MHRTSHLLLAALIVGTLLAGIGHTASTEDQPRTFSTSFHDATTPASVNLALAFEPGVRARDVNGDTGRGAVTLHEAVRTEAERQLVIKVPKDASGVEKVVNEFHVRG